MTTDPALRNAQLLDRVREQLAARSVEPDAETIALLKSAADTVLRSGQNQKVGSSLDLPALAHTIRFIKHRTAAPTGRMMAFRQITSDIL